MRLIHRCSGPGILLTVILTSATPVTAIVHHVPGTATTIQAGIDAALPGDTVLVAPGIYTGPGNRDLDFGGIDLVLLSEQGPEQTIIESGGSANDPHRGFLFHSAETNEAIVEGFTIRGGWANHINGSNGAGIHCDQASPTIRRCVIAFNVVADLFDRGGGVYLRSSLAKIEHCTIRENWATYGGGIACRGEGAPAIIECEILRNEAGYGGGLDAGGIGAPRILDCLIAGNDATNGFEDPGSGGGLILGGEAVVERCTITGNTSGYGAGVACWSGSPRIAESTIAGNDARLWQGGGISATSAELDLDRTILWGNCAEIGSEFLAGAGGTIRLTRCVYDSTGATQDGGQLIDGGENLIADPLFCMAEPCEHSPTIAGDYRISSESPCAPPNNPIGEWIGAQGVGCPAADAIGSCDLAPRSILGPLSPNPTTREIRFRLDLVRGGRVAASLIDVTGRRIATILDRSLDAGSHQVRWDRSELGIDLPSGVYIVRVEAEGRVESRLFRLTR